MKCKPRPDTASATPPLLKVGLGRPHGGVVGHVVVRGKQLHLGLTRVDDEHNVVDGDGRLGNVCRQDHLKR